MIPVGRVELQWGFIYLNRNIGIKLKKSSLKKQSVRKVVTVVKATSEKGASFYPNEPKWYPNDAKYVHNWYTNWILCNKVLHSEWNINYAAFVLPIDYPVNSLISQPNFVDTPTNHTKLEINYVQWFIRQWILIFQMIQK